ncbi:hypothetical protein [Pedomonas sp. V897]|uniref:hypothetical protein n=1 Tax=Pedomonas sp. V897 TaxID=3446482 RepID=UPI003EE289AD
MPHQPSPFCGRHPNDNPVIRCSALPPSAQRLLWLTRLFIAARLDYARAEPALSRFALRCSRAVPILLCHLLLEISRHATRRVQVASPCHGAVVADELRFLATIDLAQQADPRLAVLVQEVFGTERPESLAPVVAATRKLGEVLLQEGIRVEARSLLPADALPSIH